MLDLYILLIWLVAAALFVAVSKLEPNRRFASALQLLIVATAVAASISSIAH